MSAADNIGPMGALMGSGGATAGQQQGSNGAASTSPSDPAATTPLPNPWAPTAPASAAAAGGGAAGAGAPAGLGGMGLGLPGMGGMGGMDINQMAQMMQVCTRGPCMTAIRERSPPWRQRSTSAYLFVHNWAAHGLCFLL